MSTQRDCQGRCPRCGNVTNSSSAICDCDSSEKALLIAQLERAWSELSQEQAQARLLREALEVVHADREFMFQLLDDIDTLDDAAKENDAYFRKHVYRIQQRRYEKASSDGYKITWKSHTLDLPTVSAKSAAMLLNCGPTEKEGGSSVSPA